MGKNKQMRFISELRVEGFAYQAIGNSTNKKDAQANAARDFCQYLVRTNEVKSEEVPGLQPAAGEFGAGNAMPMGVPPSGPPPGERGILLALYRKLRLVFWLFNGLFANLCVCVADTLVVSFVNW